MVPNEKAYYPWAQRALVAVLRVVGLLELSALGAVFLPTAWMEAIHAAAGLGKFPHAVLTQYLTRSLSLMYAFHGALVLYLSFHVREHRAVVRVLGWLTVLAGLGMLALDLWAAMPLPWTLAEGPTIVATGLAIALLSARLPNHLTHPQAVDRE